MRAAKGSNDSFRAHDRAPFMTAKGGGSLGPDSAFAYHPVAVPGISQLARHHVYVRLGWKLVGVKPAASGLQAAMDHFSSHPAPASRKIAT